MTGTLVARLRAADPDRLAMALLAPAPARARLLSLYALNDELARTALAARDPLIAEMRVRWWADRLAAMVDGPPQPHELLTPIWDAWGHGAASLGPLAEARLHDAAREPLADVGAVLDYADATGGTLMQAAGGVLGASGPAVAAQGRGAGLVAWLRARPALQQLGLGLARPAPAAVQQLAGQARAAFAAASDARRTVPRAAAPALFAGAGIHAALAAAARGEDPAPPSDFARRASLAGLAMFGRWWI